MAITFKHARERGKILDAAVKLATDGSYVDIRRKSVAQAAGVADASINVYFGTMDKLRSQVIQYAMENKLLAIIRQAVVSKHPLAEKMPKELIREAMLDAAG